MINERRWFKIERLDLDKKEKILRFASSLKSASVRADQRYVLSHSVDLTLDQSIERLKKTNWALFRMFIDYFYDEPLCEVYCRMSDPEEPLERDVFIYIDLSEDDFFKVVKEFNIEEHQYGD